MALTKHTTLEALTVNLDGTLFVYEIDQVWEGGLSGTLVASSPKRGRLVDIDDDTSTEDLLIQDVVSGNLHSQDRRDARATAQGN
jgi:hypothetical protein